MAERWFGRGLGAALAVLAGSPLLFYMYVAPPFSHACATFAVTVCLWTWLRVRDTMVTGRRGVSRAHRRPDGDHARSGGPLCDRPRARLRTMGPASRQALARQARRRRTIGLIVAGTAATLVAYSPQLFAARAVNGYFGPDESVGNKMSWTSPHALGVLVDRLSRLAVVDASGAARRSWAWPPWHPGTSAPNSKTDDGWASAWSSSCVLQIYINGAVESWTVAGSFGQRRFVELTPLLILGLAALTSFSSRQTARRRLGCGGTLRLVESRSAPAIWHASNGSSAAHFEGQCPADVCRVAARSAVAGMAVPDQPQFVLPSTTTVNILSFADTRFPIERANGVQTMATCRALAARGHHVTLLVKADSAATPRDPFQFYGVTPLPTFTIEAVGSAPTRRMQMLWAGLRRSLTSRADVVYTRDLGLASLLARVPQVRTAETGVRIARHRARRGGGDACVAGFIGRRAVRAKTRAARPPRGAGVETRRRVRDHHPDAGGRSRHAIRHARPRLRRAGWRPALAKRSRRSRLRRASRLARIRVRAAYAGHLYPWKGVDVFLHALAATPDVDGLIVGGHPGEADLARVTDLAQSLQLGDRLTITGLLPPHEVAAALAGAQVFVLPNTATAISERYTSPLKLFEYMALGGAIIASDLPALREVLTHDETAWLVPPGDVSALADALSMLATNQPLRERLGQAALALSDELHVGAACRTARDRVHGKLDGMISPNLFTVARCPDCSGALTPQPSGAMCSGCHRAVRRIAPLSRPASAGGVRGADQVSRRGAARGCAP